jgi:hypothetical protein
VKAAGRRSAAEAGRDAEPEPEPQPMLRLQPEPAPEPEPQPQPEPGPAPVLPSRTWLDDLEDTNRDGAVRARRLIAALGRAGIDDAEALVRRDLLGGTPAVATRLLARAVLAALAGLTNPNAAQVAEAVASALASSPKRDGLPGWELTERDGSTAERRSLRLTADDLRAAAEHEADRD